MSCQKFDNHVDENEIDDRLNKEKQRKVPNAYSRQTINNE